LPNLCTKQWNLYAVTFTQCFGKVVQIGEVYFDLEKEVDFKCLSDVNLLTLGCYEVFWSWFCVITLHGLLCLVTEFFSFFSFYCMHYSSLVSIGCDPHFHIFLLAHAFVVFIYFWCPSSCLFLEVALNTHWVYSRYRRQNVGQDIIVGALCPTYRTLKKTLHISILYKNILVFFELYCPILWGVLLYGDYNKVI